MTKRRRSAKDWSPRGKIPGAPVWPEFVDGYLHAALWTGVDDDGQPLDKEYGIDDFSEEAVRSAIKDSNAFIRDNLADLEEFGDPSGHGHDFWLTRNRHGAGFRDRGYGAAGLRLWSAAGNYAELHVWADGHGTLHFE